MNLIYDRTQSDVDNAIAIRNKYQALGDWSGITEDEIAQLKRGTYSCFDDMNRVDAAVRELGGMLTAAGYPVRYTSPVPQPKPEYTPLSYIESTGTQYIDTGYKPNNTTKIELRCQLLSASTDWQGFFGARVNPPQPTTSVGLFYNVSSKQTQFDYGNKRTLHDTGGLISDSSGAIINIAYDKNKLYVNDTLIASADEQVFQSSLNLFLCASNDDSVASYFGKLQIYLCKLYDNGKLVRDFAPAEKDGVVGLYDRVEKKMYGNSGTGDFISNASYTELTYIESTGTQYIDTGFKPNNNTTIVANVEITNADTDYIGLFGARDGSTKQMWAYYDTTTSQWSARYNKESKKINDNYSGKHTISIEKNIFVIDGTEYTFSAATFTSAYTAYIFAINSSGAVQYPAKMKIYDCQIYDNGVLVRDYISAIQNGSVGLYERVENKMYLNAGTGEFIAGKVVPQPEPPPLPVVTEFSVGDIINYDIWRTYIDNVQALRDAYYVMKDTPKLPEPTAPLKFDGANAIEKLIFDVQVLYYAMSASYRKCGTFQSGTNTQRLPLQRSVT